MTISEFVCMRVHANLSGCLKGFEGEIVERLMVCAYYCMWLQ